MSDNHRRRLPHFYPPGQPLFITFRTNSPLSNAVVEQIKIRYSFEENLIRSEENQAIREMMYSQLKKKYFFITDEAFDEERNVIIDLSRPEFNRIIINSILYYDNKKWDVFCIFQ